jgi:ribosomal protein S18 acetylase RimI-like enzyme
MTELHIRRANVEDACTIAEIHIAAWRESYAGLIPDDALSALSVPEREAEWREILADAEVESRVFLASCAGEKPAGFVFGGRPRSQRLPEAGYAAEIYAIYVLRSMQRQGAGAALMANLAKYLLESGFHSAGVWVFRDNLGARRFYEALGAMETGLEGDLTWLGVTLPDLAYGWPDLTLLAAKTTR